MSLAEKKCIFVLTVAKNVNFELNGDKFFMMSISKIMVPLQSPGFLLYVVELAIVLTIFVKRLQVPCPSAAKSAPKSGCCDSLGDFFNLLSNFPFKGVFNQPSIVLNCSHGTDFIFVTYLIFLVF